MIKGRRLRVYIITTVLLFVSLSTGYAADDELNHDASQAVGFSAGWIGGNGITYRRYYGDHFLQGTVFGIVQNSANDAYVDAAVAVGSFLHKVEAVGVIPPIGLKVMAGADFVIERRSQEKSPSSTMQATNLDKSYYGAGIGLDIGNPGRAGLSLWLAVNYLFAYDGFATSEFDFFGVRPAGGILYGW